MAENPVVTMARLLGGVVLMHGRLGHQVLGQMLVMGSHEVAVAGANVVFAGTSRQRNAVAQVALRTAAPALAVRGLLNSQTRRLERREELMAERERQATAREQAAGQRDQAKIALLEGQRCKLQADVERLATRLRSLEAEAAARRRRTRPGPPAGNTPPAEPRKAGKKRSRPPSKS